MCQYGQGVVRGLFEEFPGENLKGFVAWLPMMPEDNAQAARREAQSFEDLSVVHMWDPKCQLGELFSKTLGLGSTAWDVYCLYPPGVKWEENNPPEPTFWMHQLPAETGADWKFRLNPTRIAQEVLKLLGYIDEPSWVDLGSLLHEKGILTVARERSTYSLEDLQQAYEDSRR